MVKKVLTKSGKHLFAALVVIGWISFTIGFLVKDPIFSIFFLAIARVLP